jgi:hypothetical protein
MKILINGSSVSSGSRSWQMDPATGSMNPCQTAWPYHLQKKLNCDMVNLAVAGAGNTYIHESTISEISQRSYDLVLIMWTDFNRTDIRVSHPNLFSSLDYTSQFQSKKNTIPGLDSLIIDTDLIQQNWIFSGEYHQPKINQLDVNVNQLFGHIDFFNSNIYLENSLIRIISLQSVLKAMNIPYRFMFYKELVGQHRFPYLVDLIDWNNVVNEPYLFSLAHKNNWWNHSTNHPTAEAYSAYADILIDCFKDQKLI